MAHSIGSGGAVIEVRRHRRSTEHNVTRDVKARRQKDL